MKLQNLGKKLCVVRERSGLSVREAARRLGIASDTTYGRWEAGTVEPSIGEAAALAEFWGVPLAWLADDSQDEPPDALELDPYEEAAIGFYQDIASAIGAKDAVKELAKLTAAVTGQRRATTTAAEEADPSKRTSGPARFIGEHPQERPEPRGSVGHEAKPPKRGSGKAG